MPKPSPRFDTLAAATGWAPAARNGPAVDRRKSELTDIESIFGSNIFGLAEMRSRLPKQVYKAVVSTLEQGQPLDPRSPTRSPSP